MERRLRLLVGSPVATAEHMRRLLVRLAVHGPVRWVLCDNFVDLQQLIYEVVQLAGVNYADVLQKNITITRAETCYQVAGLLSKIELAEVPIFVTDLLLRFHDQQVSDEEASAVLDDSIQALKRLCQVAPVVVTASPSNQRPQLYASLAQNVDRIVRLQEKVDMGHTTPSMTMRVRGERDRFLGFRRALFSRDEQLLFDEMWNSVEAYIPAAEKSSHPLLVATILMAMLLDMKKDYVALQCQIEMLKNELKTLRQTHSSEMARMKGTFNRLEDDFDKKLQKLRSDLVEIRYQY